MGLDHSPTTATGLDGPRGDAMTTYNEQEVYQQHGARAGLLMREPVEDDGRREMGPAGVTPDRMKTPSVIPKRQSSAGNVGRNSSIPGKWCEDPEGHNEATNTLTFAVGLQGLLSQFGNSKVRADFVNGKFGGHCSPERLTALDEIRWSLFPRWTPCTLEHPGDNFVRAADHLEKLRLRSTEKFVAEGMSCSSQVLMYGQWNDILEDLGQDSYWSETPASLRCTHFTEPTRNLKAESVFSNSKMMNVSDRRVLRASKRPQAEEITLFTSSDSSSNTHDNSSGVDSSPSSSPARSPRRACRSKRRSDKREVVVPPPFEANGKTKLKDFLELYEEYFQMKYNGNSYDMCQHLESFLQGDLLEVYKVWGGRRMRYSKMKEKLLEFFKKSRVGGKSHWRAQLLKSTLNDGENLDLYGMRLLGIAELAFPKSQRECASQVRSQFLHTIPKSISSRILDAERAMRAFSGGKAKHLSFSAMTEMAKELQSRRATNPLCHVV